MTLEIREIFINKDMHARYGDSGWYECWQDKRGDLYRALVKEYGRCIGSAYINHPIEANIHIKVGWVFLSRVPYEGRGVGTYLRETWVEVRDKLVQSER